MNSILIVIIGKKVSIGFVVFMLNNFFIKLFCIIKVVKFSVVINDKMNFKIVFNGIRIEWKIIINKKNVNIIIIVVNKGIVLFNFLDILILMIFCFEIFVLNLYLFCVFLW